MLLFEHVSPRGWAFILLLGLELETKKNKETGNVLNLFW